MELFIRFYMLCFMFYFMGLLLARVERLADLVPYVKLKELLRRVTRPFESNSAYLGPSTGSIPKEYSLSIHVQLSIKLSN